MKKFEEVMSVSNEIENISAEEAKKKLNDPNVQFIDVRDKESFSKGTIGNAMHLDRGLLEFYLAEGSPIENDTFKEVWHNLYNNSSDFLLESLDMIEKNETNIITHLDLKESYAPKINKKELEIKWEEPNILIHNKVRAFNPLPSMFTHLNQKRIKIVKSSISNYSNDNIKVGTIVADADKLLVKCGTGFLEIVELRPDSKKNMKSIDFINGFSKFLIPPYNVFK